MPELLEMQRDIALALRDPARSSRAAQWFTGRAELVEQRLAIYQANVAAAAAKALAAAYPVIKQVVGGEFFDGLARAHQRSVPSRCGDLSEYGATFGEFLAGFSHARSLPYLPDLARLEWAVHRAYGAGDSEPMDQTRLAQVAPARQASIRFDWAAGTGIVDSRFPIVRIWCIHQRDHDGGFEVDWTVSECAWMTRDDLRVTVSAITASQAAFIAGSLAGQTLGVCTEAALASDPAFDLAGLLARAIASNAICGFTADKDEVTIPRQSRGHSFCEPLEAAGTGR